MTGSERLCDRIVDQMAQAERARLGEWPEQSVAIFVDLGLENAEIARYFGVSVATIAILRAAAPRPARSPLQPARTGPGAGRPTAARPSLRGSEALTDPCGSD